MALETLKDVKEIGGFEVCDCDKEIKFAIDRFINIVHSSNVIEFKIQNGPIKEVGVNGCQVETIIAAAKMIIEGWNQKLSCRENAIAITKLDEAILWLMKRTTDREKRGVEGLSKE